MSDLAAWLGATLGEAQPLYRGGPPRVARLALALEPSDVPEEISADALFLHRARRLGDRHGGLGVLSVHDGFDAQLTTGPNLRLARALNWTDVQQVRFEGQLVGISAMPPQATWAELHTALNAELGGEDAVWPPAGGDSLRLALMNAMNPALIHHVADLGVRVYLTGQLRPSATAAARARGLGVVALGHRRSELWGLRQLARELRAAFPGLETEVYPA